ncbi:MAG: dockerin type I repeat-containing protein [Clostridia bacterium]|nr:dockerin type I repeat-containing protein [Clostridia bacterium]
MMFKRFLGIVLSVLMVLAMIPAAALAENISASETEAKKLALLDSVWADLKAVEEQAVNSGADRSEVVMAIYKAALNHPEVDKTSFDSISEKSFFFTVDGMACCYDYVASQATHPELADSVKPVEVIHSTKNGPTNMNVLLVGPYYGHDSSFTDQYRQEAQSIAEATGGDVTILQSTGATGPAIAAAAPDAGVVIYDSHGTQSGTSSYLCLTTNEGITSEDYSNGWAVSSGSAAYIDGRYILHHAPSTLPNNIFWMAICEGMKRQGQGTTGYALLEAGAGCVYGYSQSVTFVGDYMYEETFWNEMKYNDATVAEAFDVMIATHGEPDPRGDAWAIVMSPDDPFPANPDSHQDVNCDWKLFGGSIDPVALESWSLSSEAVDVLVGYSVSVNFNRIPDNANMYELVWRSGNENIAFVNGNNRRVQITGVAQGATNIYCDVYEDGVKIGTGSCAVNVTYNVALSEAAGAAHSGLQFSTENSYPWVPVTIDSRNAAKSGNAGQNSTTSTMTLAINMTAGETLSFDWKVSCEDNYDWLYFRVNGNQINRICGTTNWETITYTASADGFYTFTWTFEKDYSVNDDDDCGYVDNVIYTTNEPVALESYALDESVSVYPGAEANVTFNREPYNANMYELVWGSENEAVATVSGGKSGATVYGIAEGSTRIYCDVKVDGAVIGREYCSVTVLHYPDLNEAANVTGGTLSFTNATESYPWTVVMIDGRAAAKSGGAGVSNVVSTLRLVLDMEAGETLSFEWKASCEGSNWDKGVFYVNGSQTAGPITGQTDWTAVTYTAPSNGTYTFEWRYTKDSSVNNYDDCVYVDNVEYSGSIPSYVLGDVNGDGTADSVDALLILRASLDIIQLTPEQAQRADFNGDGLVDSQDAILILRASLRLA